MRREEVKRLNLQHVNRHEVPSPIMMSGTNVKINWFINFKTFNKIIFIFLFQQQKKRINS